jgi:hypothetical protein
MAGELLPKYYLEHILVPGFYADGAKKQVKV